MYDIRNVWLLVITLYTCALCGLAFLSYSSLKKEALVECHSDNGEDADSQQKFHVGRIELF